MSLGRNLQLTVGKLQLLAVPIFLKSTTPLRELQLVLLLDRQKSVTPTPKNAIN